MSQQLAQIQTQYDLAKTTFERQKRLWDQKIGSEIQYLQAQTQMVSLSKSVNQMKAQIAKTIIRAPFNGVIDEVFVERGQVVSASPQGLMRIVNLSQMYISTAIPEMYVGKVKVGTSVETNIASIGKTYMGRVRQVAKTINPANRSFGIEVTVPNPEGLLRPNQVAKLKIVDYSNKSAITVPTNVIQQDANGTKYVYVVTNATKNAGVAKKAIVKVGQNANNSTEILSGLKTGDVVVSEGANTVSEGMKLTF
jgi:RND family efflux transporter MFP subunit